MSRPVSRDWQRQHRSSMRGTMEADKRRDSRHWCRSCGAPIRWATSRLSGVPLILDAEPTFAGNVLVDRDGKAITLTTQEARDARSGGTELFLSHFASCPGAAAHRERSDQRRRAVGQQALDL